LEHGTPSSNETIVYYGFEIVAIFMPVAILVPKPVNCCTRKEGESIMLAIGKIVVR